MRIQVENEINLLNWLTEVAVILKFVAVNLAKLLVFFFGFLIPNNYNYNYNYNPVILREVEIFY